MAWTKEQRNEYMRIYKKEYRKTLKHKEQSKNYEKSEKRILYKNSQHYKNIQKNYQIEYHKKEDVKKKKNDYKKTLQHKETKSYAYDNLKNQGFKKEQITNELIELKRITLKTTRLCLQLKN